MTLNPTSRVPSDKARHLPQPVILHTIRAKWSATCRVLDCDWYRCRLTDGDAARDAWERHAAAKHGLVRQARWGR